MDDVVGKAWYEFAGRDDQLDRDLRDAEGKIKASGTAGAASFEKSYTGSSQSVISSFGKVRTAMAGIGLAIGVSTVLNFFGGAIGAASDLNEEVNKSQVIFGQSAGAVEDFGARADRALGQSKQEALAAMGGFGNMFRTIGLGEETAAHMSITLDQLASDMASFNNADPSDMLLRLRSGLAGEAEPLRIYGVLLSEARVQQEAYASGIAAVGTQLTEAQKVQARYSLILKDTTLQQGDFARTSTGLANTERINAALWTNSLARIGVALLPLAASLAQFASEVIPSVADAILAVIPVVEALAPIIAIGLGVVAVNALRALATQAKLTSLALKTLLPVAIIAGALEMKDAIDDSMRSMALAEAQTNLSAGAYKALLAELEKTGDWGKAAAAAEAFSSAAAKAMATAAADGFRATRKETADGMEEIHAVLADSAPGMAAAAEIAWAPIIGEMEVAKAKARAAAFKLPAEIAQAILDGRDTVVVAAALLANAATDPLVQKQKIAEIRQQMHDLATMTAKELEAATPATRAADAALLAQLDIELAGYLLRADPQSKEAAQLLAKYANSEEPATKAAYDALMTAVETRAETMRLKIEAEAEAAGISPEEAFKRHLVAAGQAAAGLRLRVAKELIFAGDARGWGDNIGTAWSAGLVAGLARNVVRIDVPLSRYAGKLIGFSPPKEGPLREIDKGGYNIGLAWGLGVNKGISATGVLAALGGPGAVAAGVAGMPGAPTAAGAIPVARSGDTIYQLNYNGREEVFSSPYDAIDRLIGLGTFSEGRTA